MSNIGDTVQIACRDGYYGSAHVIAVHEDASVDVEFLRSARWRVGPGSVETLERVPLHTVATADAAARYW